MNNKLIILFHGDNSQQSRQAAQAQIKKLKTEGSLIQTFEAKEIKIENIINFLKHQDLFVNKKAVFLPNLSSLHPKQQEKVIEILKQEKIPILVWEQKKLTAPQIKRLNPAQTFHFPLSRHLYRFLEGLLPHQAQSLKTLSEVLKQEPPELFLWALKNHLKLLYWATFPTFSSQTSYASWQQAKLKKQATLFSPSHLKTQYLNLIELETAHKSGQANLFSTLPHFLFGLLMLS